MNETGVDRETVARYDPRREPKPAKVSTGPTAKTAGVSTSAQSTCEPYRHIIESGWSPEPFEAEAAEV